HARARGSRLSRESDEPLLLLQDGAVAPARPGGAAPRARHRVRRHERRRPARASSRVRRRAGGGRAFAARRGGAAKGGCPACRAGRARVRLFVALNLPAPVREALWAATARARDLGLPVKWVRGEGLHLTLKFLGDVADEQEPELAAALTRAAAGARGLSLALGG